MMSSMSSRNRDRNTTKEVQAAEEELVESLSLVDEAAPDADPSPEPDEGGNVFEP